jgi:hypothetical protein
LRSTVPALTVHGSEFEVLGDDSTFPREISERLRWSGAPDGRAIILILGMHRSGSSALARVLNLLGAEFPEGLLGSATATRSGIGSRSGL